MSVCFFKMERYTSDLKKINKFISFLPAIEFISWLLYYSLPILNGELRDEHFEHYCLLVGSLHILLSEQITNEMLNLAERCLDQFCLQHQALYGTCVMI